jgi:hypothetical protein
MSPTQLMLHRVSVTSVLWPSDNSKCSIEEIMSAHTIGQLSQPILWQLKARQAFEQN